MLILVHTKVEGESVNSWRPRCHNRSHLEGKEVRIVPFPCSWGMLAYALDVGSVGESLAPQMSTVQFSLHLKARLLASCFTVCQEDVYGTMLPLL